MTQPAPELDHACDLHVNVGEPSVLGDVGVGTRRIVPIVGGAVEGPLLTGRILDGGADWQTVRADGTVEIDARYLMETADGARIEIRDHGLRSGPAGAMRRLAAGESVAPDEYVMRGSIRMATGDDRYRWLNSALFVSTGVRTGQGVTIAVYVVR